MRIELAFRAFRCACNIRITSYNVCYTKLLRAETSGNEAILALARLGLGLGLVPRLVLENGPFAAGLVQYEAGVEFGDYDIGFVQKKTAGAGASQKKLRKALSDIILRIYPE